MPWYMQLGSIQGSVTAQGYTNWIHVRHVNFAASRTAAFEAGKGAEGRHKDLPTFSPINAFKEVDLATTAIMRNSIGGRPTDCNLVFVESGDASGPQEVMRIELKNVLLSEYLCELAENGGSESFDLNFTQIELVYQHHDETGKPQQHRAAFDVLEAAPGTS